MTRDTPNACAFVPHHACWGGGASLTDKNAARRTRLKGEGLGGQAGVGWKGGVKGIS